MIQTKTVIWCLWTVSLAFLLGAPVRGESAEATDVEKETAAAIDLLSITSEGKVSTVLKAVEFIQRHPSEQALDALIRHLDDPDPSRRRAAVYFLQMIPWDDGSPAFAPLRKLLTNSEALTRGMSAMALASLGDEESFDALVKMLQQDDDPYVRRSSAWALGELKNQKAMDPLTNALTEPDEFVRANAQNAIERLRFRQEFQDVTGPSKAVYEGVWLISGSNILMETRISRAVAMIRSVPEPIRNPVLEKLKSSKLEAVKNAIYLVRSRL